MFPSINNLTLIGKDQKHAKRHSFKNPEYFLLSDSTKYWYFMPTNSKKMTDASLKKTQRMPINVNKWLIKTKKNSVC